MEWGLGALAVVVLLAVVLSIYLATNSVKEAFDINDKN